MKKSVLFTIVCLLCVPLLTVPVFGQVYQQSCSSCHASMAEKPFQLKGTAPADLMNALSTPCYDYGKVLEEWYYVQELFVASEALVHYLEGKRLHATAQLKSLRTARDKYRILISKPVTSLASFKAETGALRYEVGKVYRELKASRIGMNAKNVYGVLVLATFVLLFLIVTGWDKSSGHGVVNPSREHEDQNTEPEQKEAVKS